MNRDRQTQKRIFKAFRIRVSQFLKTSLIILLIKTII